MQLSWLTNIFPPVKSLPWLDYHHLFDKPWLFPTKDAEQVRAPLSPSESDPLPFLDPVKKAWILAAAANNVGQTKLTPRTNDAKIDIWRKKNIETFKRSSSKTDKVEDFEDFYWKTVTFTSNIYHYQCGKFIITRLTISSSSGCQASRAPPKRSFPPHSGRSLFWLHRRALGGQGVLTFTLILLVS